MQELFGKVDNLEGFTHPKFNEKFKFMNEEQSINLAKRVLEEFLKSGYQQIVIIESGTSPLISIIKKLKEYKKSNLNLMQIKIPRDLDFNLYKWFETYLSKEELILREEKLKELCSKFNLEDFIGKEKFSIYDSISDNRAYSEENKEFHEILKGTKLYEIFTKPFLIFDEYINAGTIIRNFNGIVRLFTDNPQFKLSAYCMFLDNPDNYGKIAFTIYDNSTELEAYRNGAYPFENRIDLIEYYYFISKDNFQKVYLKDLKIVLENLNNNEFYNLLNEKILKNNILNKLIENLEESQVREYVSNNDITRYLLKYLDEKIYGKNRISDFFDQVFELYAPSWSPMPVIFHLDYWSGFDKIQENIENIACEIAEAYKVYRLSILREAVESLENNNKIWKEKIEGMI